ncbi:MAG: hypothetical protein IPL26_11440 [Leptospiraceae bacterium]|nr:hypothetical protein [Leptospiraceae bacterium]
MSEDKNIPNPYGRKGGIKHQEKGKEVEIHQVGKQTKSGIPVIRERKTIEEVGEGYGMKPEFHSYNNEDSNS